MRLTTLRRLLIDELQEMYIAGTMIEGALPRMEQSADAPDLKELFRKHTEQTKAQIARLETVFEHLEDSPRGGHGLSVKALLSETEDRMGEGGDPHVVDASLIAAAKRVEHWEIASYSTAQAYAKAMDQPDVAWALGQTLEESQAADARLTAMADKVHNVEPAKPK